MTTGAGGPATAGGDTTTGAGGKRAALRRRPPESALRWAARQIDRAAEVIEVRALTGGMSHANHLVMIRGGAGTRHRLVLRRWAWPGWRETDAEFDAHREVTALSLLARTELPTPRLLAADPGGEHCDVPAVLLHRLPGRPPGGPGEPAPTAAELARTAAELHETPVLPAALPGYRPYHDLTGATPPAETCWPALWERAFELVADPMPAGGTLVHRDYHPGNTLWSDGRLSGVVDWTSASLGDAGVDLGHMRWNLAALWDLDPDDFLAAYVACRPGYRHEPYWDVRTVLDLLLPGERSPLADLDLDRLEGHLARAVGQLTRLPRRRAEVRTTA